MVVDPGVIGRFDLAALVQPYLLSLFVWMFSNQQRIKSCQWRRLLIEVGLIGDSLASLILLL